MKETIIVSPQVAELLVAKEEYEKMSHSELVSLLIKKDLKIKKLRKCIAKAREERDMYKQEMERCMQRNKRQKKDNEYQMQTVSLYKKLLSKLVE